MKVASSSTGDASGTLGVEDIEAPSTLGLFTLASDA